MSYKRWRIAAALAFIAVLVVGVVVALDPFPGNRVYSNLGALEVRGVSTNRSSPARFQSDDGATATVQLGDQTARVTIDRLELPDGRVIPIPAACKVVELRESRNGMRVFLDGVEQR